jgi:hypothetical protein
MAAASLPAAATIQHPVVASKMVSGVMVQPEWFASNATLHRAPHIGHEGKNVV